MMVKLPAEPLSDVATELTLELYVIFAMFSAILNRNLTAIRANEFLGIEFSFVLLQTSRTVLESSEVWLLALTAHEVRVDRHRVFLWLLVVGRRGFDEFRVFHPLFELQSIQRFLFNVLIQYEILLHIAVQLTVKRELHPRLAQRAETVVEPNTRSDPSRKHSMTACLRARLTYLISSRFLRQWKWKICLQPSCTQGPEERASDQQILQYSSALFSIRSVLSFAQSTCRHGIQLSSSFRP